jgi:alanine racemase
LREGTVAWAEIDLDALQFNLHAVQRHIGPGVQVIAVVKANAYGHGALQASQAALQAGASMLAVHRLAEAAALRQAGIEAPLLVMGHIPAEGADLAAGLRIIPTPTTTEFLQAFSSQASAMGVRLPIHIKIDSGLSRYGLLPEEALDFLHFAGSLPGIELAGIYTHFATADWADPFHARQQLQVFQAILAGAAQAGFQFPLVHAANSAATLRLPEAHFNAVRPGLVLYGMQPSAEWPAPFEIRPVLSLKSLVARLRTIPAGAGVSYGRTYVAQKPTRVALVPVGYGDGYHRSLSGKGLVLVGGQRAPILGRVCMDQFVVDVSHIPTVQQDDEVVLLGRQGESWLSAEEIAALAGTINYEITTSLLPRLSRAYHPA